MERDESIRIGGVTVDLAAERIIGADGRAASLRRQSFAVLRRLAAAPERMVSKDELMAAVWPGIAVTDDSLVQCIHEIRRALGPEGGALRTVPRRGYQLVLPAEAEAVSPAAQPQGRRFAALLAVAVAVVLIAAGAIAVGRRPGGEAGSGGVPVVAVLPFADRSAAGDLGHLADGVAEDVITMLGRSPDVAVVARGSSFAFGEGPVDPRAIGRELGAAYVVEGSVRREGDLLHVSAQLDDARTGRQVWARRFDEASPDPAALIDEVAERIIVAVAGDRGAIRRAEFERAWGKDSTSLDEYDYAMRALAARRQDHTPEANARSEAILREGLERFPDSVHLQLKLAWTIWRGAYNGWSEDLEGDYARAEAEALRIAALPGQSPWVASLLHSMLGYMAMRAGNYPEVLRQAELSEQLSPHDPAGQVDLAEKLVPAGAYDKALENLDYGAPLAPDDGDYHHALRGWIYRLQGRLPEAAEEYGKAAWLAPYLRLQSAITLRRLGRTEEAQAAVREALGEQPDLTLTVWREITFYADPAILEGEVADLRALGLPE